MAGALVIGDYQEKLAAAGFKDISIEITRVYDTASQEGQALLPGFTRDELAELKGTVASALIRAIK